jgi:hypothetical protein
LAFATASGQVFFERVSADCVLALALVHHLHVAANLPLAAIRDLFYDLTHDYLVLEFVPREDRMFQSLMTFRVDSYEEYSLENCQQVFEKRFELLDKQSINDSLRTLIFYRKIK